MATRVLYVVKRYPRLSETFILNEIRALERCGIQIEIVSLMQAEAGEQHAVTRDIAAQVEYFPSRFLSLVWRTACSHVASAFANPAGYARALLAACSWAVESRKPASLWKHFLRAGHVAAIAHKRGHTRLHAHFAHGPSTVAHLASLMSSVPFSFTAHAKDLYLSRSSSIARRVAAATFVATCTKYNADYIANAVAPADRSKIALIYHGIDLAPFQHLAQTRIVRNSAPYKLLCVGRLVEKKGISDLIHACRLLRDNGIAVECTIVGSGPLRSSLQQLIDDVHLCDCVTLTGAMSHERLRTFFERAEAFVLPSTIANDGDRDGIPNVLVEAAAAKIPVITTAISGIPELIEDGLTGLLVQPRSPAMLAEAIRATLEHPEETALRVAAAAALVALRFNVFHNSERLARRFSVAAA